MFRTNRSRTLLTILGISVGIGAILFLVSLGYGLQRLILNKITSSDALLSLDVSVGDSALLKLDDTGIESLKKIPNVDQISPLISAQTQIVIDGISSELVANMVDQAFFKLDGTILKKGKFYTDDAGDVKKIIISSAALQLFNIKEEDAIGKNVKLTLFDQQDQDDKIVRQSVDLDGDYEVSGIIEEESSSYIYLPYANSQVLKNRSYSKIKVRVNTEQNVAGVRNAIIEKGYIVSALSDIIEQANQVFKILQIVLASFGIVALIVSAIGMFNTMTIALLERTQEIGIMKALGATSLDIWAMFLAESVIIGFFGGLGGILLGMLGGEVFNYLLNILAGSFGGERIDLFYTPLWFILLIISFSTFVGLATGFYPARRAARINCLEALRYK